MRIRCAISAAAMTAFLASPGMAQDGSDLPPLLEGVVGLQSAGISDGLELFTIEGAQLIIGRAEGQNDIFVGMVFDEAGGDVGAGILGTDQVTFDDVLEAAGGTREASAVSEAKIADGAEELMAVLQEAKTPEEFVGILRDWQDKMKEEVSPETPSADVDEESSDVTTNIAELLSQGESASETAPAESAAPASAAPASAQPTLEELLQELENRNPDQADEAQENVTPASGPSVQETARGIRDAQNVISDSTPVAENASVGDPDLDSQLDDVMSEAEKVLSFDEHAVIIYDAMVNDAFSFTVGDPNAPIVHAFLDPACIFCSRSIEKMRPLVESGQIRLSAIPVPAISPASPDAVARIVTAENPARALFDNARFILSGGTDPLPQAKFDDLDEEMKDHIRFNRKTMNNLQITQVPFFSFMTDEGPMIMSGVPEDGAFDSAILVE